MGQLSMNRVILTYAMVCAVFIYTVSYAMYTNHQQISSLSTEISSKDNHIESISKELAEEVGINQAYEQDMKELYQILDKQQIEIDRQQVEIESMKEKRVEEIESLETKIQQLALAKKQKANQVSIASVSNYKSGEWFDWKLTHYSLDRSSTGKSPGESGYGVSRSGRTVKANHTIACPKNELFFPKNSKGYDYANGYYVEIKDVGIRQCEDTGSAITMAKQRIDLYLPSKTTKELYSLGVKKVQIRILKG